MEGSAFRALSALHLMSMAAGEAPATLPEVCSEPADDRIPIAQRLLPVQFRLRIPGRVAARSEPSPVGARCEQDPGWLSQRPGEVDDGAVDANDEVEIGDNRSRIGEGSSLPSDLGSMIGPSNPVN